MIIEYKNVRTWKSLFALINKDFYNYPGYIFRGHGQDNWKIESTLTRLKKEFEITDDINLEKDQMTNFKLFARGKGFDLKTLEESELWAIGQHYGLATPLIDWTNSPFVALFFAITGLKKSETGKRALWAFCHNDLEYFTGEHEVELVNPIEHNLRLVNQNGLFIKTPTGEYFEDIVSKQPDQEWVTMYKITFPDAIINDALAALELMNINFSSLFPDMLGASLASNQIWKLYNHIENSND